MKIPTFADDAFLPRVAGPALLGRDAVGAVQPGEPVGTVGQPLHGDVGDAFRAALEIPLGNEQDCAEDFLPQPIHQRGQTMRLAMPLSSSMVMNTVPLAVPGRWRTMTTSARRSFAPSRACVASAQVMAPAAASFSRSRAQGWARSERPVLRYPAAIFTPGPAALLSPRRKATQGYQGAVLCPPDCPGCPNLGKR